MYGVLGMICIIMIVLIGHFSRAERSEELRVISTATIICVLGRTNAPELICAHMKVSNKNDINHDTAQGPTNINNNNIDWLLIINSVCLGIGAICGDEFVKRLAVFFCFFCIVRIILFYLLFCFVLHWYCC